MFIVLSISKQRKQIRLLSLNNYDTFVLKWYSNLWRDEWIALNFEKSRVQVGFHGRSESENVIRIGL